MTTLSNHLFVLHFAIIAGSFVFPAAVTTSDAGAGPLPNCHAVVAVGEGVRDGICILFVRACVCDDGYQYAQVIIGFANKNTQTRSANE